MMNEGAAANPYESPEYRLLEVVETDHWQRMQDHFSEVLGVTIRTVSPKRELLVTPSWPPGLSAEQTIRWLKIGEELESLIPLKQPPQDPSSLTTTLGITYAIVPVRFTVDSIVGYFVVGPVMVGPREDEVQFRQRISAMGLDATALWTLLLSLKSYTFSGIRSVMSLMEEVGTSLAQLCYQTKKLSTIVPITTSRLDRIMVGHYTDRIMRSLLEAATLATRAEGGSVMTYDVNNDDLRIKAADGLSDEVIANTRLKRGEGIAGLAATERSIFLVDDQTRDSRIKNRMARPQLVSSLVASVVPEATQNPIGVLNLRTANPQGRFTGEHVELVRRLLDLAGVALGSLQTSTTPYRSSSSSQ